MPRLFQVRISDFSHPVIRAVSPEFGGRRSRKCPARRGGSRSGRRRRATARSRARPVSSGAALRGLDGRNQLEIRPAKNRRQCRRSGAARRSPPQLAVHRCASDSARRACAVTLCRHHQGARTRRAGEDQRRLAALLKWLLSGDARQFERLVEEYHGWIMSRCVRYLGRAPLVFRLGRAEIDVAGLTQRVYLRLWEIARSPRSFFPRNPCAFLERLISNFARSEIRRVTRARRNVLRRSDISLDELEKVGESVHAGRFGFGFVEERIFDGDVYEAIYKRMRERDRLLCGTVLDSSHWEQVGERLRLAPAVARMRYRRLIQRLRALSVVRRFYNPPSGTVRTDARGLFVSPNLRIAESSSAATTT